MKDPKFSKTIYVTKDNVGNEDEYCLVWDDPSASECDEDLVATYELKSVGRLKLETTITPVKTRTSKTS